MLLAKSFVEEPEKILLVAARLLNDQPDFARHQIVAGPEKFTQQLHGGKGCGAPGERLDGSFAASSPLRGFACRRASRSSVRAPDWAVEANVSADETISRTTRFEVKRLYYNLLY